MAEDGFTLRTGTPDDFPEIYRVMSLAFNDDPDDAERDDERTVHEPDRAVLALAGDTVVGTAGAYSRELTIPGGTLPAAHVTMVAVDPAYHRRGLLTRMMSRQLTDVRSRGEAVAVLWAREGRVYQRLWDGAAGRQDRPEVERGGRPRDGPP